MPKLIAKRLSRADPGGRARIPRKPELLSPAGDWDCARAAVENGADAIYFGLDRFNARMRGKNFNAADLPELMAFLHGRGVKGYVTFNTLVFANEWEDAESFLRSIIVAGVDAAIVQDVGICRLIREISPDFPIHASTQMSVTSEAGVEFAHDLGCSVVVLARECSLDEVAAIRSRNEQSGLEMPLEIFVHGALCVAYSGQCLTSESLGGRSANRGECAQACRLPYELISDGIAIDLGSRRYLLSPQDLSGLDAMPAIIEAGVATLKIEGRLKSPEYVAAVTKVYRQALDTAWLKATGDSEQNKSAFDPERSRYALEMTFSRGLSSGWLEGIDNQKLVHARYGKKRGVRLGVVKEVNRDGVGLELEAPLKAGDGIVFDRGRPDESEEGGRVISVDQRGSLSHLRFLANAIDWRRVQPGDTVYKTSDPSLDKELRQSYEGDTIRFARPVEIAVYGAVGTALTIELRDNEGHVARAESSEPLAAASKRPLDTEILRQQLGRLGGTPFRLATLTNELSGACHLSMSQLNQARRDAVSALDALRRSPRRWTLNSPDHKPKPKTQDLKPCPSPARIIPFLRSLAQLDAVLSLPYDELYVELEDPRQYAEAVKRSAAVAPETRIWAAPPRIFKTGEDRVIRQILDCGAYGYLARNHEHLRAFSGFPLRGDFSLNVANPASAAYFVERWKLERLTASYDLNASQLAALLERAPPEWFEITLHQHMPMFHMEHCVFCAFLSEGKDFRDCGRPCDTHQVSLKDRVGAAHPLKADAGCRNTLFNARAQTGAEFAPDLLALGARVFRIEFLNENAEEVIATLDRYERLLRGELSGQSLWRELKLINQLGVTRGTLRER